VLLHGQPGSLDGHQRRRDRKIGQRHGVPSCWPSTLPRAARELLHARHLTLHALLGLLRAPHLCVHMLTTDPSLLNPIRLTPITDCSALDSLRPVLLTDDSALNTLSLCPVPRISPFPDCSVFRDLALLAACGSLRSLRLALSSRSRIAPRSAFSTSCGSTDCSVRSHSAPLCCLRIAPYSTLHAPHRSRIAPCSTLDA
jgi:hypothetical protein